MSKHVRKLRQKKNGVYYLELPDTVVKTLNLKLGDEVAIDNNKLMGQVRLTNNNDDTRDMDEFVKHLYHGNLDSLGDY